MLCGMEILRHLAPHGGGVGGHQGMGYLPGRGGTKVMNDDELGQWAENIEAYVESQIGDYDDGQVELWRVAQALNVSAVVLQGYVNEGMPQNHDGTFDMAEVVQWMME